MEKLLSFEATAYIMDRAVRLALKETDSLNLEYHNSSHVLDVIRRSGAIITAVEAVAPNLVKANDKNIAIFAAAFHDIVQNYVISGGKRKRFSPQNEEFSAQRALSISLKTGLFTEDDEAKIKEAILATIAIFNSREKTVYQPSIGPTSSIPALAVAFADINGAGIDGAEAFKREGDSLFLEDNPGGRANYSDWLRGQVDFAKGRKALFQQELTFLPVEARGVVAELFIKFDESIKVAQERAQHFS